MPIGNRKTKTMSTALAVENTLLFKTDPFDQLACYEGLPLPKRIVMIYIILDESDSMSIFRRPGFVQEMITALRKRVGERAIKQIYVKYAILSTIVTSTQFIPLSLLSQPSYEANGSTPLGQALSEVSKDGSKFIEEKVLPAEVSIRHHQCLLITDGIPDGESKEQTDAGVKAFVEHQTKYRVKTTIVGPSKEVMNWPIIERLGISKESVQYLNKADPETLLNFTVDSLVQASRKLG